MATGRKRNVVHEDRGVPDFNLAFAKRLHKAVDAHPEGGQGHGKQKWLRERLEVRFDKVVTSAAIGKYFSGLSLPKRETMEEIAIILGVDGHWLATGATPTSVKAGSQRTTRSNDGYLNLVAGMLQIAGRTAEFITTDGKVHLTMMLQGVRLRVEAVPFSKDIGSFDVFLPEDYERAIVIGVAPVDGTTGFQFFRIPSQVVSDHARSRGGFFELTVDRTKRGANVKSDPLPEITRFDELEGEIATRARARAALELGTVDLSIQFQKDNDHDESR